VQGGLEIDHHKQETGAKANENRDAGKPGSTKLGIPSAEPIADHSSQQRLRKKARLNKARYNQQNRENGGAET